MLINTYGCLITGKFAIKVECSVVGGLSFTRKQPRTTPFTSFRWDLF